MNIAIITSGTIKKKFSYRPRIMREKSPTKVAERDWGAPVQGDINLSIQSCCLVTPTTLMPTPIHKIASRRGSRDMIIKSKLPKFSSSKVRNSMAPIKIEATE